MSYGYPGGSGGNLYPQIDVGYGGAAGAPPAPGGGYGYGQPTGAYQCGGAEYGGGAVEDPNYSYGSYGAASYSSAPQVNFGECGDGR
mmetsp:Transcript_57786/g.183180  ORF Transcript_57786/g.183180 Transcript_57786/m.183180 type:complete len:87 (-) Transcript_57786:105-365(-)